MSLLALVLPMVGCASATKSGTYFYVNDYFQEKFGDVKPLPELKADNMMYVDSDAFKAKFGVVPVATPPKATLLPLAPRGAPSVEEAALLKENNTVNNTAVNETQADANGSTEAANETAGIDIIIVPLLEAPAGNATVEGTNAPVNETATANGTITVNGTATANGTPSETANVVNPEAPSEDEIPTKGDLVVRPIVVSGGDLAVAENPEDKTSDNTTELATGAAIEGGVPMQIAIIGLLIVIIVVMLVVLLAREEPKGEKKGKKNSGDDDWQEGAFFKEAKDKKNGSKAPAAEAGKPKNSNSKQEKKEVKPFLLKIKEEI